MSGVPSFAELEAAGARIGEIRVIPNDIFDLTDPAENNWLFRLANKLHPDPPGGDPAAAALQDGDPVSVQAIEETERLLRAKHYLYEVSIQPVSHRDGVADIEVKTRDTWSLDLGIGLSRENGENKAGVAIKEDNLLGTGITLGIGTRRTSTAAATRSICPTPTCSERAASRPIRTPTTTTAAISHSPARPFLRPGCPLGRRNQRCRE